MLKRACVLLLVLITFTAQVSANSQTGLKAAFDELNYSLNVEWDQKDLNFYNAQSEKFTSEIMKLQEMGLSNKELMDFAILQIKDKKLAHEIQTTFSLVSIDAMSSQEAQEHIKKAIANSYGHGASWNGATVLGGVVLVIIIVAVIGYLNKDAITKEAEKCYMAYKCHEVCELGVCRQVCGEECI